VDRGFARGSEEFYIKYQCMDRRQTFFLTPVFLFLALSAAQLMGLAFIGKSDQHWLECLAY
jgi:hypothetical protein